MEQKEMTPENVIIEEKEPPAEAKAEEITVATSSSKFIPEPKEYTIDVLIQKILDTDKQYDLSKIVSAYELAENRASRISFTLWLWHTFS